MVFTKSFFVNMIDLPSTLAGDREAFGLLAEDWT
jgi:hypothetical protein